MIPLLLSLTLGLGALLTFRGFTAPPRPPGERLRRVEEFLQRAGLREVSPRHFLLVSLAAGVVACVGAQLLLGWGLVSVIAAGLGAVAPFAHFVGRADRRRAALQDALVQAIEQLRDGIRGGFSVQEGLAALARSGPEALRAEFEMLGRETRLAGFEVALGSMRERLADPVFDIVASALLLSDRLGGRNVSQVLDRLAQATRAQTRTEAELRAYRARNVLSARIVAALPFVVLFGIRAVNPRYLAPFDTASGQLLLAASALSVLVGYAGMVWITRLPGDRRVLR